MTALGSADRAVGKLGHFRLHVVEQVRDARQRRLRDPAEPHPVGKRGLHGLEGLEVAANALGHREDRGVVARIRDAVPGLDPFLGIAEHGIRRAQRSQGGDRADVGVDGVRHGGCRPRIGGK
jgi:hypothetical protein